MNTRIEEQKKDIFKRNPRHKLNHDPEIIGPFRVHVTGTIENKDELSIQDPPVLRKAQGYKKFVKNVKPVIYQDELIVGEPIIHDFPPYLYEEEHEFYMNPTGIEHPNNVVVGYKNILQKGFNGVKIEAEERLKEIRKGDQDEYLSRESFLQAVIICCEAVKEFSQKYSEYAKEAAENSDDSARKQELLTISDICLKVPYRPAETFYEALQAIWLTHILLRADGSFHLVLGRFDQYMYPYYIHDLNRGSITKEYATELLQSFWLKFNSFPTIPGYIHGDNGQTMVIGGQDENGKDATNQLSYLCLDAAKKIRTIDPKINVRFYKGTDREFLKEVCELALQGMGFPLFNNDDVIVPSLQKAGYSLKDARDYSTSACYELLIPGKSSDKVNWADVCFLQCLEAALNNGKSMLTGEKWGPDTGNLRVYDSFNDLWDSFKTQIKQRVELIVAECNSKRYGPAPLLSSTMDNCIENAKDISDGGCLYNYTGLWGSSMANTANAIAAIKKFVYEEKEVTKKDMLRALQNNFEGYEALRKKLIKDGPKFGQDDDYVDSTAKEFVHYYADIVSSHINNNGDKYKPSLASAWSYLFMGKKLGASADGRKAREPFSNGMSPALGTENKGPTAVIKSITKLDMKILPNGSPLDIKYNGSIFKGGKNIDAFIYLVKTFADLGGAQVQFNIVNNTILKEAQKQPDNYRDIIVRVWGFSSYFVTLTKDFQDHIIARSEHKSLN